MDKAAAASQPQVQDFLAHIQARIKARLASMCHASPENDRSGTVHLGSRGSDLNASKSRDGSSVAVENTVQVVLCADKGGCRHGRGSLQCFAIH